MDNLFIKMVKKGGYLESPHMHGYWLGRGVSQKCPVINIFFFFAVNSEFGNKIIQIGHTYSIVVLFVPLVIDHNPGYKS